MTTFEDLGLPMELVEGLMAAGAEEPTRLQADATPVLMRGNPAVLAAGPGAGTLWAWAAPTLARVMEDETPGSVLVLTRSAEMADEVAEVVGRLAAAAGLRVVGEGRQWVLPELAHVHVLSATAAAERLSRSNLSLDPVRTVVIDAGTTEEALAPASRVLEAVPTGVQKVMVALPLTSAVDRFTEQHLRKAVHIPPRPTTGEEASSVQRGTLEVVEVTDDRDVATVREIARRLESVDHVAVFTRSEDVAADLGDRLFVHGIAAGRPGEPTLPVWLVVDPLAARDELRAVETSWVALSHDVPADEDELDRRHSGTRGVVLTRPREIPHLQAVARRAGYDLSPTEPPPAPGTGIDDTLAAVTSALESQDVAAYLALLEPAFREHGTAQVAAAAVALLRARGVPKAVSATPSSGRQSTDSAGSSVSSPSRAPSGAGASGEFTMLFVSLGSRDGMRVGDLVGAILGETGISSDAVGKIDLRENFSRVEIASDQVDQVISSMNGTTIRGRSVRVDLDRSERGGGGGGRDRGDGGRRRGRS
ncbi:MAG TPA: DEAD/DEAH box helicase [Longimicrobiales bacterium]|nr:DEAD/DEAH box helicase [Longimicrobiales bacterium]